ncbi:major capsid protein [Sigmofec virus UA08Rod_5894]|uniref:Major capsid protein n=1 Tax=Sigmofec virus UA08Rod_5894 TaxID=2929443 RepID=A0A976N181_9VIRU|nr:major capsid protein [Sigmofec virus UA08Rod_5894]
MNRNVESHFSLLPRVDISRSTFDRSHSVKTSFNVGDLIPFYVDEVLPGDSFHVETSKVVRMQSLLTPIMDNIYLDTYFFFVPNRLVWEHWREFNGENTKSAWLPTTEYEVPQITSPATGGWSIGTIADYMGVPTGVPGLSVNAMPFRAYSLICNEWFRDENLTDPLVTPIDDSTVAGVNTGNYITDCAKGGLPFKAAKYHDYFTSCLPSPQKGPDVTIPVGSQGPFPVVPMSANVPPVASRSANQFARFVSYGTASGNNDQFTAENAGLYFVGEGSSTNRPVNLLNGFAEYQSVYPANLWAQTDGTVQMATINQLRMAFQIQKLYEKDARGGTRYIEILKAHFGVTSPDARLQRPEYLGGNRIPINVNQVLQQSQTTDTSPQGTPVGQSLTSDHHSDFRKSFVEHGFVIGLMVARYDHTYQQGLERFWSRRDRFDYYWPVFANIGEQAVKNKEIFAQGTEEDDEVFGYQEAWADYRYKPSHVTGEMRSAASQSLDVWHLADDYAQLPSLSDSWIREDHTTVDRVIAVTSRVSDQLFADIYIRNRTTRPMPMYSVPGLIDHH